MSSFNAQSNKGQMRRRRSWYPRPSKQVRAMLRNVARSSMPRTEADERALAAADAKRARRRARNQALNGGDT